MASVAVPPSGGGVGTGAADGGGAGWDVTRSGEGEEVKEYGEFSSD